MGTCQGTKLYQQYSTKQEGVTQTLHRVYHAISAVKGRTNPRAWIQMQMQAYFQFITQGKKYWFSSLPLKAVFFRHKYATLLVPARGGKKHAWYLCHRLFTAQFHPFIICQRLGHSLKIFQLELIPITCQPEERQ